MKRQVTKPLLIVTTIGLISVNAAAADVKTLENGKALTGLSGAAGSEQFFMLDVPAGASDISFSITGGSGDADLYVRVGELPTARRYDCRPYRWGNEEQCTGLTEDNIPYYIMINGWYDFEDLTLSASFTVSDDDQDNGGDDGNGDDDDGSDDDGNVIGSCTLSATQQALLDAHNNARASARSCGGTNYPAVPALSWNCKLGAAANKHSQDMATNNFMDHTGSDGSNPGDRIAAEGYSFSAWAENVAAGYSSVDAVMNGWLQSSGHCRNIMSSSVTELGADMVTNPSSTYSRYWTAVFARPQ